MTPPTEITNCSLLGCATSPSSSSPPSLPAAATTTIPWSIASLAASPESLPLNGLNGRIPGAPPRDREMTFTFCSTHQSIACATTSSLPCPLTPSSALATNKSTFGATPLIQPSATNIPAILVPCPLSSYGSVALEMKSLHPARLNPDKSGCVISIPESTIQTDIPSPSSDTSSN